LGRVEEAREILTDARAVCQRALNPSFLAELYLELRMQEQAYHEREVLRQLDPSLADALAE
jgi:hypothetical protein